MLNLFRKKSSDNRPVNNADWRDRLARSRSALSDEIRELVAQASSINEDLLDDLEAILLGADLGVSTTTRILDALREAQKAGVVTSPDQVLPALQAELFDIIEPCEQYLALDPAHKPYVILMVGVNGVGKTTTIGKLTQRFGEEGLSVMLAAGDTFRAAAAEQLQVWGQRNNVPVVTQQSGADPAAVIFDAMQSANAKDSDVLIADTAGRLHTQSNLMAELEKVVRVVKRQDQTAPHEVMLVVDASTGQNALHQAREFNKAVKLSGITVTKLDGTARGGILFAIANELKIPIRFIGVGERAEDLRPFDAASFIDAILPLEAK